MECHVESTSNVIFPYSAGMKVLVDTVNVGNNPPKLSESESLLKKSALPNMTPFENLSFAFTQLFAFIHSVDYKQEEIDTILVLLGT